MDGIFISYRRDDSAGYAGRLYDRLVSHFGAERVFMDVEHIEPGTDFVVAIEKAVESCRVLIALIGDEWLDITDAQGRRRLDDPNDFIRLETSAALKRDIRVVPVLLDGAAMPNLDDLPEDLQSLVRRQAVELTHKQWDATSGELIRTLEKILDTPGADTPPPTAPVAEAPAQDTAATTTATRRTPLWLGLGIAAVAVGAWLTSSLMGDDPTTNPPVVAPAPTDTTPPESTPQPVLAAPTSSLDFGQLSTGERKLLEWRIDNSGAEQSGVTLTLAGEDVAQFAMPVETCSGNLRDGSSCSVSVQYRPTAAGAHLATLTAKGAHNTVALTLTGRAVTPPPVAPPAPSETAPQVNAAPTPAPAPTPSPAPAKPQIAALSAFPEDGGAKVCYRVSGADTLHLNPTPGRLSNTTGACVSVKLGNSTRLTLVAENAGGKITKTLTAEPAAPAVAAPTNQKLPAPGDTWVYRMRGKWANSPKRTVAVTVDKVENDLIYETMTQLAPDRRPGGSKRSSNASAAFVEWVWLGWEFSPWFATSGALREGQWAGIRTPEMNRQWGNWRTHAKLVGRGNVTVPAGTFQTVEVLVLSQRRQSGSQIEAEIEPTNVKLTLWYSPKAKRYVKMERIVLAAAGPEIERDVIELIEYKTH